MNRFSGCAQKEIVRDRKKGRSGFLEPEPRYAESDFYSSESEPEANEPESQSNESESQVNVAEPQVNDAERHASESESESGSNELESQVTEPEPEVSKPEPRSSELNIHSTESVTSSIDSEDDSTVQSEDTSIMKACLGLELDKLHQEHLLKIIKGIDLKPVCITDSNGEKRYLLSNEQCIDQICNNQVSSITPVYKKRRASEN